MQIVIEVHNKDNDERLADIRLQSLNFAISIMLDKDCPENAKCLMGLYDDIANAYGYPLYHSRA